MLMKSYRFVKISIGAFVVLKGLLAMKPEHTLNRHRFIGCR